jgi:hypothetical protein
MDRYERYHRQPLFAEADCAGLPNTLRHPSLSCARFWRMQAIMRSRSGISDEHSLIASPEQSRL